MPETINYQESSLRIDGAVAEFTHLQGGKRNPMTMGLRDDYARMLDVILRSKEVRALILTGSGGSFCAGGDVKGMRDRLSSQVPWQNSPDATRRRLEDSHRWLQTLRELDIPVIAAVDGAAAGAGFSLALQADFLLASTSAVFSMAFARIGAVPDFGALYLLPRLIGLSHAKELMLSGRKVRAEEAKALGFVHAIHSPDDLLKEARRLALRLSHGPREANAMTKKLLNRSFETDYGSMATLEAYAQGIAMDTPFHAEAAARFATGQQPIYDWEKLDAES